MEGLILKGQLLLELKKVQEAALHFREAINAAPGRYEGHRGLTDCYLQLHRTREAIQVASTACKHLGSNARTLTVSSWVQKIPVFQISV